MWTATKLPATFERGLFVQQVWYTDGVSQKFFVDYQTVNPSPDWPDAEIRSRIAILDSVDISKISSGPPRSEPAKPVVPPKTQAQLDQEQFFADYNAERTDQILKTLTPELAGRYKPEYGYLR